MVKVNRSRARGGDDDFGEVGAEPTSPAKYAGTCAACGQRFAAGDPIAPVVVEKRTTYQHDSCRYPATALLQRSTGQPGTGDPAGHAGPGMCQATTSKGKPCAAA